MSVLFYRRPDYHKQPHGPINASDCARYVQRAKSSERAIPNGLGFDDVLENTSLPPCSLNDFMDYLVYVEHNAENLQFYLWYKDYVRRFNALSENEKKLSPEWTPELLEVPNLTKDSEKQAKSKSKRATITAMMEGGYDPKKCILLGDTLTAYPPGRPVSMVRDAESTAALSIMDSLTTVPSTSDVATQAGMKWQPFTIQPMRDEINRIMRHYLAFTAPRELNLSHKDRALCLHALQHTTHPSAMQPAITIAEAALRGQCHPNFIRWSICNGNKPRVYFVRAMGVSNIAFGFVIATILTLSRASRWFRILAAVEWFLGISTMVAAYKGLCVILHKSHARNLRPWEQVFDAELGEARSREGRSSLSSTTQRKDQAARHGETNESEDLDKFETVNDGPTTTSFQTVSMQTFGPKNCFEGQNWVEKHQKKGMLSKVFEQSVWTQDETLRVLQDKIVLGANLWAAIITVLLTVAFVTLPKGEFF